MAGPNWNDQRDVNNFVEQRKITSLEAYFRQHAKLSGGASAEYEPPNHAGYVAYLEQLRATPGWFAVVEQVARISFELKRRYGHGVPLCRKMLLNSNTTLSVFWGGSEARGQPAAALCVFGADHCAGLLGGSKHGLKIDWRADIPTELLEVLGHLWRKQNTGSS